ncbi:MAG: bifunctional hydroxymethylpyrimidine kinase/phosphomethylpyrimidine kinase [Truepera sp.]|nr:bifunctional hydroxymethylpyrimidine kinase/phosphomethylpyrimidine kinase [Truepera sp.]MBS3967797.1 bifunctional hydroxymethylpyrimidine kinase/phosphomethylpyrimidine kinase [Truepera sp.]
MDRTRAAPAVALSIAGSDSGGGAGIQADLKTFAAHRVFGTSAVTLITAQNTRRVSHVHVLEPALVVAQLKRVLEDFPVKAAKTGALGTAAVISALAPALQGAGLPLVIDPVMIAKSGDLLLELEAITVLREELLPLAALVTPNVREAEQLFGLEPGQIRTSDDLQRLAESSFAIPVLLKGGHLEGSEVTDYLVVDGQVEAFRDKRIQTRHLHGTGCTLSAAITARLALGEPLPTAVRGARRYLQAAIEQAPGLGQGHGPLEFFPGT